MGEEFALRLTNVALHLLRRPPTGDLLLLGDADVGLLHDAHAAIDAEGLQTPASTEAPWEMEFSWAHNEQHCFSPFVALINEAAEPYNETFQRHTHTDTHTDISPTNAHSLNRAFYV